MNRPTSPAELFREVREIDELVLALVARPDSVDWHWPTFYLLYAELDRVSWQLQRAAALFAGPVAYGHGEPADDGIELANACFESLRGALLATVDLLWKIARGTMSKVNDPGLRMKLSAHFHPKSSWYQALHTDYLPGRISADGQVLARTILVLEPAPRERIGSPQELFLLKRQVFDLSTVETLAQLSAAANDVCAYRGHVLRSLGKHFVAHCTIEKLLHPSSV